MATQQRLGGYLDGIAEAVPGKTVEEYREIEDYMRHIIFHSTLDWQTKAQLTRAARTADKELALIATMKAAAAHNCDENAIPYKSNGALGHGWECGICGKFLQAG